MTGLHNLDARLGNLEINWHVSFILDFQGPFF